MIEKSQQKFMCRNYFMTDLFNENDRENIFYASVILVCLIIGIAVNFFFYFSSPKIVLYCNFVSVGDTILSETQFVAGDTMTLNENITINGERDFFGYLCLQVFSFTEDEVNVEFTKVIISRGNLSYNIPINRSEKIAVEIDLAPKSVRKGKLYCFVPENLEPIWFQKNSVWNTSISMKIRQNGTLIFRNVMIERIK